MKSGQEFVLTVENRSRHVKATALLFLTALLWSLGGLLIKKVDWQVNPLAVSGMRSAFALPVLLILLRRGNLTFSTTQIGGAVSYASTVLFFVVATKMTTAANAILLQYSAPVFVAIFGWMFLKERVTKFDWITIAVTLSGMSLFFLDELTDENLAGNFYGILSGLSFACMFLFMRKQKHDAPVGSIFLGNILAALVGLPFMFEAAPDPASWLCLATLGVFQLGLSYVLYSIAIKHVTALEAIMITAVEPILNPVWVTLFTKETPGRWAIFGGAAVVLSVIVRSIIKTISCRRDNQQPPTKPMV